jgi:two-component system, OmpR family, KDP operon response regulator KdpE
MSNSKHSILLVDDDRKLLTKTSEILEMEGYQVLSAVNGKEASKIFDQKNPSLVLLELDLPDMDGLGVCRNICSFSKTPVIMLSGRAKKDDIAAGLYAGADDYITKPFAYGELLARVATVLRRATNRIEKSEEPVFQYKDLKISFQWQVVTIQDKKIDLTETEYKILLYLANHIGETVAPGSLAANIWSENTIHAIDAVRVNISRLRNKLNGRPGHHEYISTIYGQGYSFS